MVMVPLEAEAVGFFTKWGAKIAMAAAAAAVCIFIGAYGMHKWDAGTIEGLKADVSHYKTVKSLDDGTIAGLRKGINDRNAQIAADKKKYDAKVVELTKNVDEANAAAAKATAAAQKLLTNKPRAGQDVIASGVDQVMESLP